MRRIIALLALVAAIVAVAVAVTPAASSKPTAAAAFSYVNCQAMIIGSQCIVQLAGGGSGSCYAGGNTQCVVSFNISVNQSFSAGSSVCKNHNTYWSDAHYGALYVGGFTNIAVPENHNAYTGC
jgi:hypothetical protein